MSGYPYVLVPICPDTHLSRHPSVQEPICPGPHMSCHPSVLAPMCPGTHLSWYPYVLVPMCPGTHLSCPQTSTTHMSTPHMSWYHCRLSIAAIKAQCLTLLGRLEVMGPGAVLANNRRKTALEQDELWRRERCAQIIADKQGYNAVR